MKLQDDYEYDERKGGIPVGMVSVLIIGAMLLVVAVVFFSNNSGNKRNGNSSAYLAESEESTQEAGEEQLEARKSTNDLISGSTLTAEDLDFWDMYPEKESIPAEAGDKPKTEPEEEIEDPAEDGKHTKLTNADGTEEWVLISPYLTKNNYDFTNLVYQSNIMKYYENGKLVSFLGIDVSKYHTTVNFTSLKNAGVDYVMLRVGARGYSTGQITLDENFHENLLKAKEAGLSVGVYFYSQAITEEEAVEEANFVLDNIRDYEIDYPVAFWMEEITNDKARIDTLGKNDRTTMARAFLNTIKEAGYVPMVYGTKEWLVREVDLSKLSDYEIWLSQSGDIPDYPYRFSMWQYTNTGSIKGISGYAEMNISFIDYSAR